MVKWFRGFGAARMRELLHRFGPPPQKRKMADEHPFTVWRERGETKPAEAEGEEEETDEGKESPHVN